MRCLAAQESDLGVKSALFAKQNFYESCEGYYVHRYLVNVVSGLGRENTFEKKRLTLERVRGILSKESPERTLRHSGNAEDAAVVSKHCP